jgi:virulence plasmid B protein
MNTLFSLALMASLIMGQFASPFHSIPSQTSDITETPTQIATDTPLTESTLTPTTTETLTATTPVTETATPAPSSTPAETASPTVATTATATVATPTVQTPSLSLLADPSFITPGGNLLIEWTIGGIALEGQTLVLKITIPDAFVLQGENIGVFDEVTRILAIPITVLSGEIHLKAKQSAGDTTINAFLMKDSETLTTAELTLSTHEQFMMDEKGGTIESKKEKLKISIPPDTFDAETIIDIGEPSGDAMPAYSLIGQAFEISAKDKQTNAELHQFSNKMDIEVDLEDLNIPQEKITNLFLYWYNPETQDWEALQSSANPKTKILKGKTDHFSVFAVGLNEWQAARMPTVDDFQVSNFTGAATFSLPIEVPAGPGGLQPSLTLSYNSQVVDQATFETQASWVGMGWSLETGSIELDTADTIGSLDDTYFINVGGISARLMPDPNNAGIYHAADENFWKYNYDATADTWTVQDKVGNINMMPLAISPLKQMRVIVC